MKTPPNRLANSSFPAPSPSGPHGQLLETPMHKLNPKTLAILFALAIVPTGCFDPLVTEETQETNATDDPTSTGSTDSDTAESTTAIEPDSSSGAPEPVCGNGVVEGTEACDDGVNDGSYGGCNADCTAPGPFCGDGVVNGDEPCDDGDDVDGNGCNVDCVVSGTVLWTVTYDGPDHGVDSASDVTTDSMGNVIVSGNQSLNDGRAGWLRKYTTDGATVWTVDVTSPYGDTTNGPVAALLDDSIVFGGNYDTNDTDRDAWLWRYSAAGESTWTQSYASPQNGSDSVRAVETDSDGYLYVLFEENNAPTESTYRTFVRKYSPEGAELWTRIQDPDVRGSMIAIDGQDNLIMAGTQTIGGSDSLWSQKMNSDGAHVWTQLIDAGEVTVPNALTANSDGMIAIIVNPYGSPSSAIQLAADGSETGTILLHPNEPTVLILSAHLENSGNLIVGGSTVVSDDNAYGWISKYNAKGDELWTNTYDGDFDNALSFDIVLSVTTDLDGNVIAAGRIHDSANLLPNIWVSKYTP